MSAGGKYENIVDCIGDNKEQHSDDEIGSDGAYLEGADISRNNFLVKGAFLLTPCSEIQMERIALICEKMNYKGPFSVTKTATGILFKFSELEDYHVTFRKGFHKVTGSRLYRKIEIPCRPQKIFTIFAFDIPDEIPEADIRHALYKFRTVVEVCRIPIPSLQKSPTAGNRSVAQPPDDLKRRNNSITNIIRSFSVTEKTGNFSTELGGNGPVRYGNTSTTAVVRITLASFEECDILLKDGLDFYGATFFPTEPAISTSIAKSGIQKNLNYNSRIFDIMMSNDLRIKDLLPAFDTSGSSKIPTPITKNFIQ